MTPNDIAAMILDLLDPAMLEAGVDRRALSRDTDLREAGLIDSLRFMQLLADIESRLGTSIDLAELDPALLTRLDALSSHIASALVTR